jgi:hypothetical protein
VYRVASRGYDSLHGLPADVSAARFCGSGNGGWLLLAFQAPHGHGYALYNLNSGHRIPLPPTFRYLSDNVESPLVVHAATFSHSTCSSAPFVVAAIAAVDDRPTAAFWFQGCNAWFTTDGEPLTERPQDVIFREREGTFCFIMPDEQLIMYGPAFGPDGDVFLRRWDLHIWQRAGYSRDLEIIDGNGIIKRYLLDNGGRLFMIMRFVYNVLRTDCFQVLELFPYTTLAGPLNRMWMDVNYNELEDLLLFVGLGCSRCFEVDPDDEQGATIFFLDESLFPLPALPPTVDDAGDDTAAVDDPGSVYDMSLTRAGTA